jgi:hypothetical protein
MSTLSQVTRVSIVGRAQAMMTLWSISSMRKFIVLGFRNTGLAPSPPFPSRYQARPY